MLTKPDNSPACRHILCMFRLVSLLWLSYFLILLYQLGLRPPFCFFYHTRPEFQIDITFVFVFTFLWKFSSLCAIFLPVFIRDDVCHKATSSTDQSKGKKKSKEKERSAGWCEVLTPCLETVLTSCQVVEKQAVDGGGARGGRSTIATCEALYWHLYRFLNLLRIWPLFIQSLAASLYLTTNLLFH